MGDGMGDKPVVAYPWPKGDAAPTWGDMAIAGPLNAAGTYDGIGEELAGQYISPTGDALAISDGPGTYEGIGDELATGTYDGIGDGTYDGIGEEPTIAPSNGPGMYVGIGDEPPSGLALPKVGRYDGVGKAPA